MGEAERHSNSQVKNIKNSLFVLAICKNFLNFRVSCDIIFPVHFFVAAKPERRLCMAVNYNKLWKMMIDKKMSKTELTNLAGISTNAMAKLGKNEDVRVNILEKLCTSLDCKLDDIVEFVPNSKE
mgnify:CR=1 FL=1